MDKKVYQEILSEIVKQAIFLGIEWTEQQREMLNAKALAKCGTDLAGIESAVARAEARLEESNG